MSLFTTAALLSPVRAWIVASAAVSSAFNSTLNRLPPSAATRLLYAAAVSARRRREWDELELGISVAILVNLSMDLREQAGGIKLTAVFNHCIKH